MTDFSPDGQAARTALDRATMQELSGLRPAAGGDRIASEGMREPLQRAIGHADAGERLRDRRTIVSPFQSIRQVFDLMAGATEADWQVIATRMERVPQALASFDAALREGQSRKIG